MADKKKKAAITIEELQREWEGPQSIPELDNTKRLNGTPKGTGYFGNIKTKDGGTMTEVSIGTPGDPNEPFMPLLVPTLDREEIDTIANGGQATKQMFKKARKHADERAKQGLSAFAGPEEVQPLPKKKRK